MNSAYAAPSLDAYFAKLTRQAAKGRPVVTPRMLPKLERRLYIRQVILEDHSDRMHHNPEGAQRKFDKLASEPFKFFRGTALIFYRDYVGHDLHLPQVFTIGDVHPSNFGVMPNENNVPFFGANDFDEAGFAPFSYDLKRGATGFYLGAREEAGLSKKKAKKIVKHFVKGYLDGLHSFNRDDRENRHEYRIDNSPPLIKDLLEKSLKSRKVFLDELVDMEKAAFCVTDEVVPYTKYVKKFQRAINRYVKQNEVEVPQNHKDYFKIKDVAIKKDSGTASLGLDRFYVLIEGPDTEDPYDDIVLEIKQARRSVLHGLVPDTDKNIKSAKNKADRIVLAQQIHQTGGDPFYGHLTLNKTSYLVREYSPYKKDFDMDDLSYEENKAYADVCGRVLAQIHARSDEDFGIGEGSAEEAILSSINPDVLKKEVVYFAREAVKQIMSDYKMFVKEHKAGMFKLIH